MWGQVAENPLRRRPLPRGAVRSGRCIYVIGTLVVLGLSTCAQDSSTSVATSVDSGRLEGIIPSAVVAMSEDSGWMVSRTDTLDLNLYRVTSSQVELISELPRWRGVVATEFAGRTLIGGVRCDGSSCDGTVAELMTISDDGALDSFAVIEQRAGSPADTDRIYIAAATSDELWISDTAGQRWVLSATGDVAAGPIPPGGELCAAGDDVFRLSVDRSGDDAAFSVARWDGRGFMAIPDSLLERGDAPGPDGFCRAEGFEVPALQAGPVQTVARWQPDGGWAFVEGDRDLSGRLSIVATSRFSTDFAVGGDGLLVERSDGSWVATSLSFSLRPAGPPLGLVVDRGPDGIIACVAGTDSDLEVVVAECGVG